MDIKKLLKNNLINIGLLALIIGFRLAAGLLFDDHDISSDPAKYGTILLAINMLTVLFGLAWGGFTIYSNWVVVKEEKLERKRNLLELRARVQKAGRKKDFRTERMHLINMLDSIESRKKYFDEMDKYSRLRELFELTENQMIRNVTNACEYMETFDYISGKDTGYVTQVCTDSQHLLDRFNKLVELSVTFDDEARDYDTREIDDMIEALERMKKTGKGALGS